MLHLKLTWESAFIILALFDLYNGIYKKTKVILVVSLQHKDIYNVIAVDLSISLNTISYEKSVTIAQDSINSSDLYPWFNNAILQKETWAETGAEPTAATATGTTTVLGSPQGEKIGDGRSLLD